MNDPAVVDEEQTANPLGSNEDGVNRPLLAEQN